MAINSYVPGFDILRAVAVPWVIVHNFEGSMPGHYSTIFGKIFNGMAEMGWVGVQLFFVLSGYLITGILIESQDKASATTHFYIRRALRIFPVFYLSIFLLLVLLPALGFKPD